MFFTSSRVYQDYDACLVDFDNRNFRELIPDFPCPVISREQVMRYLEFGTQDAWGKRREQNPISLASPQQLAMRFATTWRNLLRAEGNWQAERTYSLDIRGISGGQWHFISDGGNELLIRPGLCDQVAAHLLVDTNDLLIAVGLNELAPVEQLQAAVAALPLEQLVTRLSRLQQNSHSDNLPIRSASPVPAHR
jgi:hypothetical protein